MYFSYLLYNETMLIEYSLVNSDTNKSNGSTLLDSNFAIVDDDIVEKKNKDPPHNGDNTI